MLYKTLTFVRSHDEMHPLIIVPIPDWVDIDDRGVFLHDIDHKHYKLNLLKVYHLVKIVIFCHVNLLWGS